MRDFLRDVVGLRLQESHYLVRTTAAGSACGTAMDTSVARTAALRLTVIRGDATFRLVTFAEGRGGNTERSGERPRGAATTVRTAQCDSRSAHPLCTSPWS